MQKYQNIIIQLSGAGQGTGLLPAVRATLSQSAALTPRRHLDTTQFDQYVIQGPAEYQLNVDFPVTLGTDWTTNNGFGWLHNNATGDFRMTAAVGKTVFEHCYLESLSVNIVPNAPIMASASFRLFDDDSQATVATGAAYAISSLKNKICYGHNVVTGNLSSKSDQNIASIAYSIECRRSYSHVMWNTDAHTWPRVTGFLDSVDKRVVIQNRSVEDTLSRTGFTGGFYVTMSGTQNTDTYTIGISGVGGVGYAIEHTHEAGRNSSSSISLMQALY